MDIIQHKITAIKQLYDQLKEIESALHKKQQANQLVCLCEQALDIIQKEVHGSKKFRFKTQVQRIRDTAIQEGKNCDDQNNNRKIKLNAERDSLLIEGTEQVSKMVMRTILEKQIQSKDLRISGSQFEEIAKRLENNNHVMHQIYELVEENGNNLELVQQRLSVIYEDTEKTMEELDEAIQLQMESIVIDLRLGLTGILAAIGYGLLGLPGLVVTGVFGLFKRFI